MLPADVRTGAMRCNIGENYAIFSQPVDHKCCYEAKTSQTG